MGCTVYINIFLLSFNKSDHCRPTLIFLLWTDAYFGSCHTNSCSVCSVYSAYSTAITHCHLWSLFLVIVFCLNIPVLIIACLSFGLCLFKAFRLFFFPHLVSLVSNLLFTAVGNASHTACSASGVCVHYQTVGRVKYPVHLLSTGKFKCHTQVYLKCWCVTHNWIFAFLIKSLNNSTSSNFSSALHP